MDDKNKIIIKLFQLGDFNKLTNFLINNPDNYSFNINDDIYKTFEELSDKDNVRVARLLYSMTNIDIHKDNDFLFRNSCSKGSLEFAKWIYTFGNTNLSDLYNDVFYQVCYNDKAQIASWLIQTGRICLDIHKNNDQLFKKCCKKNCKRIVMLLCSLYKFKLNIDEKYKDEYKTESPFHFFCRYNYMELAKEYTGTKDFNIHDKEDEAISLACQEGHLEMTKWLYSLGGDIHIRNNWCFMISIGRNNIDMLKWIYSLGNINIHNNDEYIFRLACGTGKLEIAKWIHSLNEINMNMYTELAFSSACMEGHLNICEWLYSFGLIESNMLLFKFICQLGHLNILKWLYSVGNLDIHEESDISFCISCQYNKLDVAKWLYSLGGINIKTRHNHAFANSCHNNYVDMAHWLKSLNPQEYQITINGDIITSYQILKIIKIYGEKKVDEVDSCPICFTPNSDIITSCGHQYCKDCFKEYVNRQREEYKNITCPYCRQPNMLIYMIKK